MATYKESVGTAVQNIAGDTGAVTGQLWYDSSDSEFKYKYQAYGNAWSINPNSIAHHNQGSSGKPNLKNFFIRSYHNELSPLYYFEVKKNSLYLYKNMFKYFFRTLSYLLILNLKG